MGQPEKEVAVANGKEACGGVRMGRDQQDLSPHPGWWGTTGSSPPPTPSKVSHRSSSRRRGLAPVVPQVVAQQADVCVRYRPPSCCTA